MMKIQEALSEIERLEQMLRDAIQKELEKMPSMDGVQEISETPQVFSVSIHTVAQHNCNLSPRYYDVAAQRDGLIKKLRSVTPKQYKAFLEKSLQKNAIVLNGERTVMNPVVRDAIKSILSELNSL